MRSMATWTVFFLACALPSFGQSPKLNQESKGSRTCRVILPDRAKDTPRTVYLFDGKENHKITLLTTNFSEVVELPKEELVLLMSPTEIVDIENIPVDLPRLKINEEVTEFYILATPDPSNEKLPIRMNLVNTSEGKLNPGETLWFNLTDHRIVAKLGEKNMSVTPKSVTVSRNPVDNNGYYAARFAYQRNAEGKFYKITEQSWWHDAKSRHLGFIVNTGGRLPKIYYYRDFRPSK